MPNKNSKWYKTLRGTDLYDMVDTYEDLSKLPKLKNGMKVQVLSDETHGGESLIYVFDGTEWQLTPESKKDLEHFDFINKHLDKAKKNINKKSTVTRNAEALLQYGLSPTLINDGVHLYDEQNDIMIQVVGLVKDNEVLKKLSKTTDAEYSQLDIDENRDKLIIKPYTKIMYAPDGVTYNVTFATTSSESYEMTIHDFKTNIYNKPYNQEAVDLAEKDKDFTDKKLVLRALNDYDVNHNLESYNRKEEIIKELDPKLLSNIDKKYKTQVLNVLVKKKAYGWKEKDLEFLMDGYSKYLNWLDNNKVLLTAISELCDKNPGAKAELDGQMKKWFKDGLDAEKLKKVIKRWYKDNKDVYFAEEITEAEKVNRITDPGEVAEILYDLGIDSRFLVVPFINLENDLQYRIKGFENFDIKKYLNIKEKVDKLHTLQNKLKVKSDELKNILHNTEDYEKYIQTYEEYNSLNQQVKELEKENPERNLQAFADTSIVLVKRYEDGRSIDMPIRMNLSELYRHLNKPININKELDIVNHDLNNPNENLNQHKFYKVKLSDNVIKEIVNHAVEKCKDEVPQGYSIPHGLTGDTWEQYIGTRALLDTLNMANDSEYQNYKIEKATVQGKTIYRGVVPYNPNTKMASLPRKSIVKRI